MTKAMYAFSGDPIHYGHLDIISRAAHIFDDVIVGIGINPDKKYTFTLEERLSMAQKATAHIANVTAVSFQGLLVDYAYEHNVDAIVKGVRSNADFDYEMLLHHIGESQKLGLDTFLLPAKKELSHISSSVVKALQKEQGFIQDYVPLSVKQAVEATISGQYLLGVTGEIGSGKSFVCEKLKEIGQASGIPVHNIDLDHLGHQILENLTEPAYQKVRQDIAMLFGPSVRQANGSINRKALGEIVFEEVAKLTELNQLMSTPLLTRLRRELYGKKGLILLNGALLAESNLSYLCNNNVLLIDVDKESQVPRLSSRGLDEQQIQRRLSSQYTTQKKKSTIQEAIFSHHYGHLWIFDNNDGNSNSIQELFSEIALALEVRP